MSSPACSFIWYELLTSDITAASGFYNAVVGWTVSPHSDAGGGGIDYRMIVRDDGGFAGGALQLTPDMTSGGAKPCWLPYFYVDDVDAKVAAIVAEGGQSMMPATDLPVGRIALVNDPQGVPIYLMKPVPPEGKEGTASDVYSRSDPQHVRWNELASPDQTASMAFYTRHFGFEFKDKMPMGDMGDYCFISQGEEMLGAVMQRQDASQPAMWLFYFGVKSVTAAKSAIESSGGTVLMGPMEVPGGDWIVVAVDPQGAGFGVVGPKGD